MSVRLIMAVTVLAATTPVAVQANPMSPAPSALSAMLQPAGYPCAAAVRRYCRGVRKGAPQMNCLNVNIYRVDKKCGAMLRELREKRG